MNKARAIIADDEKALVRDLKKKLARLWPELEICAVANDGNQALMLARQQRPDIAFLDIQMPGLSGIDVAQNICHMCKLVFITAYHQYAVEAFEQEAVDYILKPVEEKRLQSTVARLKKQTASPADLSDVYDKIQNLNRYMERHNPAEQLRVIKVKTGADIRFIPVSEILFFKAEEKYTLVQTAQSEHLINKTIKELEKSLDPGQFWRTHRSAIVNIEKIQSVKRSLTNQRIITFGATDKTIPVSKPYEYLFKQM